MTNSMMTRFPHLAQQIFKKMGNRGLAKSREVTRTWLDFIDEENNLVYPWLRIVHIPTKLSGRNTYLHLASKRGQVDTFETILVVSSDTLDIPMVVTLQRLELRILLLHPRL